MNADVNAVRGCSAPGEVGGEMHLIYQDGLFLSFFFYMIHAYIFVHYLLGCLFVLLSSSIVAASCLDHGAMAGDL